MAQNEGRRGLGGPLTWSIAAGTIIGLGAAGIEHATKQSRAAEDRAYVDARVSDECSIAALPTDRTLCEEIVRREVFDRRD